MPQILKINIDGNDIPSSQIDDLVELVVDTDVFLPAMFNITIKDSYDDATDTLSYVDKDTFKIGGAVKISIDIQGEPLYGGDISAVLINGEITSIEPYFTSSGEVQLQIRGYDRSHRLTRGKKNRTFGDANPQNASISESDIIRKIAGEAGLGSEIASDLGSMKYHYVLQHDQTDWEFLWARARLIGYQVYVEDRKLFFKKISDTRGSNPPTLEWGRNLTSFEPRVTVMGQITGSTIYGWDPKTKAAIVGQATSSSVSNSPQTGFSKKGGEFLNSAFGEAKSESFVTPLTNTDQAKQIANAELSAAESDFIRAEGFCNYADPRLLAGRKVQIKNVGKKFSGTYYVTRAQHTWSKGGYSVHFSVSGSSSSSIFYLLNGSAEKEPGKVDGLVTGVVTNVKDPEKLGRVRVKFPWLPKIRGAELESNWARLASASGGMERGFYFLPEVNDEVLVAFEHGNVNFPYIVGVLWNNKDKPPKGTAEIYSGDGKINQRLIRSRSGHLIILDDTQGEEKIIIQDKTGQNSFTINSKDNSMKIISKGDLVIETGGKFTVNSKGDMSMDSKGNSSIACASAMSIESKREATVKGGQNQLALKPAGAELSGVKVDVKSNSMASINASAILEIKGALVKIN